MKNSKLKNIFVILTLLSLCFLIFQFQTKSFKEKRLSGAIKQAIKPKLELKGWLDQSYQQNFDNYLNDNFGFRNTFIRFYNQLSYNIFKIPRARQVIIGKDNYLYELNYIKAYYGTDYIGEDAIKAKVEKIKFLQDTLKKLNIDLVTVFAPGKATFYPEYVPQKYSQNITKTNYSDYIKWSRKLQTNYIDLSCYILYLKDTSNYPLFPKTGIHWSYYTVGLVADTLVKYIQDIRNIKTPTYIYSKIESTNKSKHGDQDIEDGLNLLFDIPDLTMAYPDYQLINKNCYHPKVLTIADSYYWTLSKHFTKNIFSNERFWFYYNTENPHIKKWNEETVIVDHEKIKDEIEKSEIVILLATDANLYKFPFGFVEDAYKLYSEKD